MATRSFTRAVTAAARAGQPERIETYVRLQPGDEFRLMDRGGRWRFRATIIDASGDATSVEAFGPLPGRTGNPSGKRPTAVRSFDPGNVVIPSQRTLTTQRRRRAAEQEAM